MWGFEVNVGHRWPCNLPMMPQGWINLGWCNFTVCELSRQKITALGPEIECLVISLASAWAKPLSHWHTWAKAGLSWTVQAQTKPLALTTPVSCKTKARAILIRPLIFLGIWDSDVTAITGHFISILLWKWLLSMWVNRQSTPLTQKHTFSSDVACIFFYNVLSIFILIFWIQCLHTYFDPLLAEEICCCVQDVSSMGGIVVRVAGVVIGFNYLQPGAQSGLRTVEELTDPKPGEDLQAKVGQWPVERLSVFNTTSHGNPAGLSASSSIVSSTLLACVVLLPFHSCSL